MSPAVGPADAPQRAVVREALCAAWERIREPEWWTKGAYARRSDGLGTGVADLDAVRWCGYGAILCSPHPLDAERLLVLATEQLYDDNLPAVNDCEGHSDIERCYALAVALAREEE